MIGRLHHVILDCPDVGVLAAFYSSLLGLPITYADETFAVVAESNRHSGIGFQHAPDHRPPRWPDPAFPQQIHFDVMVDDLDEAAARVVGLGAVQLSPENHIYADPAGHPFCLINRPSWAAPISVGAPDR